MLPNSTCGFLVIIEVNILCVCSLAGSWASEPGTSTLCFSLDKIKKKQTNKLKCSK